MGFTGVFIYPSGDFSNEMIAYYSDASSGDVSNGINEMIVYSDAFVALGT